MQKVYVRFGVAGAIIPPYAEVFFTLRMVDGIPTFSVNPFIGGADIAVFGVVLQGLPLDYNNAGVPNDPEEIIMSEADQNDPTQFPWVVDFSGKIVIATSG